MSWRNRHFGSRSLLLAAFILISVSLLAQTAVPGDQTPPSKEAGSTVSTQDSPASTQDSPASLLRLGIGDLIEVSVYGVPDLATKARIDNGGDLYLPLIDYVHMAGLTTGEAQEVVQKRLADGGFVRNPHVTILVDEASSQAINMLGEVAHPGPYSAIGERRLYDMISAAGGFTNAAGREVTIMHRENPEQKTQLRLPVNLAEDTKDNVEIRPGDTIVVSRAGIIYVVGDVQRPSGFMIDEDGLTVLKALALAGGQTRTSALNGTKILRKTASGIQEIPVPLKKVLHAKASDVAMMRGDILFVPGSAAKTVAYRTADAAFSMSTALAVVAVHP